MILFAFRGNFREFNFPIRRSAAGIQKTPPPSATPAEA
jgi:hypothetical protein